MKWNFGNAAWILALCAMFCSNYALSKRPDDKELKTDDKSTVVMMNKRSGPEGQATYLDTLNRGKEIALSEKDFKSILPESTETVGDKDGKEQSPDGFRIQCFASSQIERIRSEQKLLETKVKYPVYVVFNAPYYKLLAGDFTKKGDADIALVKLKEAGYKDAWVARTKINTGR